MLREYHKIFSKRLKNISPYNILCNNYFLIVIFLILLFIFVNNKIVIVFIILYIIYLFKKNKKLLFIILLISSLIFIRFIIKEINYKIDDNNISKGLIININKKEEYQKITIKENKYKIYIYDYNFSDLNVGDIIEVEGIILPIEGIRVENSFDNATYLKHENVTKVLLANNIKIIDKRFTIYKIKQYLDTYLEQYYKKEVISFLKGLLFADDDGFSLEFKENLRNNGITHLFAVSGLHISLLVGMINKLLIKLKMKEKNINYIIFIFLGIYLIITLFTPSILRVSINYLLVFISKKKKLRLSQLDLQSIAFIIILFINPFYIFKIGFILSFAVSFLIILITLLISNKTNTMQILTISFFAQILTLPIVINFNYEINLLSPIINILYIFLVSNIIIEMAIITILIFPFQYIFQYVILVFNYLNKLTSEYLNLNIRFPKFTIIQIILYYLLLFSIIKVFNIRKKRYFLITVLLIYMLLLSNITIIKKYQEINFLDLYNGESIIILDDINECRAVIDTGDGRNNEVTNFLKSKGVKKIDYLILTHNHVDHNGEAINILKNIRVTNVVVSAYDSSRFKNLKNSIIVQKGDILECGKINFLIIHPSSYHINENDNSIVIYFIVNKYKFLLMGDVSKEIENQIEDLDVDVLKIGHHGSKTSTSLEFIRRMNPKIAIIQTTRITKFNFPSDEVISILKDNKVIIYRTDLNYSIKYTYKKKKNIFTYLKNG